MWLKRIVSGLLLPMTLVGCSLFHDHNPVDTADVYLQLGIRYLNINELNLAKENLELAVQHNADSVPTHIALAFLYEKLNKYDEARSSYNVALNLDPENISLQNNYGRFLCDRREFTKGIQLLSQASSNMLNESPWMAMTNTGRCYMAMGDKPKAQTYFEKALQTNPNYAPVLQEMQKLSYQNGNYKEAREYLERYLTVAEPTPESLWIAIQTENALSNEMLVKEYTELLLQKFPYSNEAKQIKSTLRPQ